MSFSVTNGRVRVRRTWLFVLHFIFALAGFLPTFALMLSPHMPFVINAAAPLVYFGTMIGMALVWQRSWKKRKGALRADEHGVFLDGRRVIDRASIRHGYLHTEGERTFVRIVPRSSITRPMDIEVADAEEANKLLAAMRLDAASSVVEYAMTSGSATSDKRHRRNAVTTAVLVMVMSLLMLIFSSGTPKAGMFGSLALALWCLSGLGLVISVLSRSVHVSVGADGIHVRSRFIAKRFIPFADLLDVTLNGCDITLTLNDQTTVEVHHADTLMSDCKLEAVSLVARIREALEAHRAAPTTAGKVVARSGRTAEEWMRDVGGIREQSATYRKAVVPDEQLWRIVEDAGAAPTERAGAALALRSDLDDSGRARLRIAAGACAEKQLRVALESVATTEEEAELVRHLEPLEDRRAMSLRIG